MRLVTFHVGDVVYAVDAHGVIEILRPQPVTPVPGTSAAVAGLINVRGQIIPAIDLRLRFGHAPGSAAMNVLVRSDDGPVSLLVDRIGDVVEIDAAQLLPVPQTLPAYVRGFVASTCLFPDRLVLVLDAARTTSPRTDGALA